MSCLINASTKQEEKYLFSLFYIYFEKNCKRPLDELEKWKWR